MDSQDNSKSRNTVTRRNLLAGTAAAITAFAVTFPAFAAPHEDAAIINKAREVLELQDTWRVVNRPYDEASVTLFRMREACKGQETPPEVEVQTRRVAELQKSVDAAWEAYDQAIDELLAMPATTPEGLLAKLEAPMHRGHTKQYLASEMEHNFLFEPGVRAVMRDLLRMSGGNFRL